MTDRQTDCLTDRQPNKRLQTGPFCVSVMFRWYSSKISLEKKQQKKQNTGLKTNPEQEQKNLKMF